MSPRVARACGVVATARPARRKLVRPGSPTRSRRSGGGKRGRRATIVLRSLALILKTPTDQLTLLHAAEGEASRSRESSSTSTPTSTGPRATGVHRASRPRPGCAPPPTYAASMHSSSPVALDEWTTHAAQINGPAQPGFAYAVSVHIPHHAHASAGLVLRESSYESRRHQ